MTRLSLSCRAPDLTVGTERLRLRLKSRIHSRRASERAGERATARERTACASLLHYVGYVRVVCVYVKWVHACSHARSAREWRYFVSLWVTDQIRRTPLPAVLPDADRSSSKIVIIFNNLYEIDMITKWIIIMAVIFRTFIYFSSLASSLYFSSKRVNNILFTNTMRNMFYNVLFQSLCA